jgi:hypothetical protein
MAESPDTELLDELDYAVTHNPNDVSNVFEKLKSSNEERNSAYYSQLHLKITSYLKIHEDLGASNKQNDLAAEVLARCQRQMKTAKPEAKDETPAVCNIQTDTLIHNNIRKCLKQLRSILPDDRQRTFYTDLEAEIMNFSKSSLQSSYEYITWNSEGLRIRTSLNSLQTHILGDSEHSVSVNENVLFLLVTNLCYDLMCIQYQRRVDFVDFLSFSKSELRSILFAHIPLSEEQVQAHAKKLLNLFHPDRCQSEEKAMFAEVFQFLIDDLNDQFRTLASDRANAVNFVERCKLRGRQQWDISVEYQCARRGEWLGLKRLNRAVLINLSESKLKSHQYYYAISAYESYRAAERELRVAAGKEHIDEQIGLQESMALILHLAGDVLGLESQIYAIISIYLRVTKVLGPRTVNIVLAMIWKQWKNFYKTFDVQKAPCQLV